MSIRNGRYLKAARVLAGMTQAQLADEAGLHTNSVKRWERSSERIGGYAISRMVATLTDSGIDIREGIIVIND